MPFWTEPSKDSSAQDPLGVSKISNEMIGDLLKGITTISPRPRYNSFYTWAIGEIHKNDVAPTYRRMCEQLYKLERIFLLACVAHKEERGDEKHEKLQGVITGEKIWYKEENQVDLSFRHLSTLSGGFNSYSSSMQYLDLITVPETETQFFLTEEGEKVRSLFHELIKDVPFFELAQQETVSKEEIRELAERICLCRLSKDSAPEREELRKIYLGPSRIDNDFRHLSLAYLILLTKNASSIGLDMSDETLHTAAYHKELMNDNQRKKFETPAKLKEVSEKWEIWAANSILSFSLEAILQAFLSYLEISGGQGKLDDFMEDFLSESLTQFKSIGTITKEDSKSLSINDLVEQLSKSVTGKSWENSFETSRHYDKIVNISHPFSEMRFVRNIRITLSKKPINAKSVGRNWLPLVISLYLRNYHKYTKQNKAWDWFLKKGDSELSLAKTIDHVNKKLKQKSVITVNDFEREFVDRFIIKQEELVISGKGKIGLGWFTREGKTFSWKKDYEAGFRQSRLESALLSLRDLGLIKMNEKMAVPTRDGIELIQKYRGDER